MLAETGLYFLKDQDEVMVIDATSFMPGPQDRVSLAILVTLDSGEWLIHDSITDCTKEAVTMMFQIRSGTPIDLSEWTDITVVKDHSVLDRSRQKRVSPDDLPRLDS